jgi:hypothetical protein
MAETFTLAQANRALPLVRRIVEDIVRHHARWQEMLATCDMLIAANTADANERAAGLQDEIQRTAAEIDRFLAELEQLGVQFKGFEAGLVDFPAELEGRDVLLCWRLGETAVEHWHEMDAGFAGRKPIAGAIPEEEKT